MKRYIVLLLAVLAATSLSAQNIVKETFLYAVKDADSLRLDRYVSRKSTSESRPCIIFVFGGGFVTGERDNEAYAPFFEYYADKGYVVVSIDYRLGIKRALDDGTLSVRTFLPTLKHTVEIAVEDLYDATAFVAANAGEWGVDASKIVAAGSSAGAITVMQGEYGLCNGAASAAERLPANFDYAGVISFAGALFCKGAPQWQRKSAPVMMFHGSADSNVPYRSLRKFGYGFFGSEYIAEAFTEDSMPFWFYSVEGCDHSLAVTPMNDCRGQIDRFLDLFVEGRAPLMITTTVAPTDVETLHRYRFTMRDYIESNFGQ